MKVKALPNSIAEVIPGIRWSLAKNPPPMHYEPLETLEKIRPKPKYELFRNIPSTIDTVFSSDEDDDTETRHFGMVALSLLLLGHDYTDECHDLVLALSWPSSLDVTYKETEFAQASKPVRAFASYVHCMVHRKEAFHVGEFGMVGITENAKFWSNQVSSSGGEGALPQGELKERVKALAKEYESDGSVQEWCDRIVSGQYFDHRSVHDLATTVLKQKGGDSLREFAEQVIESEIHILLSATLLEAGFAVKECAALRKE